MFNTLNVTSSANLRLASCRSSAPANYVFTPIRGASAHWNESPNGSSMLNMLNTPLYAMNSAPILPGESFVCTLSISLAS